MTVTGVLLSAGAGRRFGRPKALVEVAGEPLVSRGIRLLRGGGCDRVLVVLGAEVEGVLSAMGDAQVVVAQDWASGMGASLRAAFAALEAEDRAAACVVALADQPLVGPLAVARLLAAWRAGAKAAVATYDGQQRNPVLLERSLWPAVAALAVGDAGARPWLRSHPDVVVAVDCSDTGDPFDLDTPADLRTLMERTS